MRPRTLQPGRRKAAGKSSEGESCGASREDSQPLCVDLEGTVLKTDLLWEAVFALVKKNPFALGCAPFWIFGGYANFKRRTAEESELNIKLLPYRAEVLERIQSAHAGGRRVVLISTADKSEATKVASHLACFDEVIGSAGRLDFGGRKKRAVLEQRFGSNGFEYIRHRPTRPGWQTLRRALRIHQWSKNILVGIPIVTAHRLGDLAALTAGALAFVAFSFVASGTYLLNDLFDLEADRTHRTKKTRAFSSGAMGLQWGMLLAFLLLCAGFSLACVVGVKFLGLLGAYCAVSLAYSARLKRIAILDVLLLAALYTLRILAGGAATGIEVSMWLLVFSMFFFFSLALVKRYSELHLEIATASGQMEGRGYVPQDLPLLGAFGIASGFISVLVFALYVRSPDVTLLYRRPLLLSLIAPLLLYWISRLWLLSRRGLMLEDPVIFALTDKTSQAAGVVCGIIILLATLT